MDCSCKELLFNLNVMYTTRSILLIREIDTYTTVPLYAMPLCWSIVVH